MARTPPAGVIAAFALALFPAAASGAANVAVGNPPHRAKAGKSFRVSANVSGAGHSGTVRFYLSKDKHTNLADPELAGVEHLNGGSWSGTAHVTIPAATPGGKYRVLACAGSACDASSGKVKVQAAKSHRLLAFSDAQPIPRTQDLLNEVRSIFKPPCLPSGHQPGLSAALADARTYLRTYDKAADHRLEGSKTVRTAGRAKAVAAGALAAGKPDAALSAYLAAYRHDKHDPELLIDAAGVMTPLGMPQDALALLDASEQLGAPASAPAGFNLQAVALDNRGYALMSLCRYGAAASALKAALALAPSMREARVNLATVSLAKHGATPATAKAYAQGVRRDPATPAETNDAGGSVPIARDVFDMSHPGNGVISLPELKLGRATVEEAAGFGVPYPSGSEGYWVRLDNEMFSQQPQPGPPPQASPATERRYGAALAQMGDVDPATKSMRKRVAKDRQDVIDVWTEYWGGQCGEFCKTWEPTENAAAACARTRQVHGHWLGLMEAYLADTMNLINFEYRRDMALAANFRNPYYHDALVNLARGWARAEYGGVTQLARYWAGSIYASEIYDSGSQHTFTAGGCMGNQAPPESDPLPPTKLPDPVSCKSIFGDTASLSINLFVASLSISCEEVDAEVAAPELIGPFIAGGYNWATGQVTVFGGVKAGGHFLDTPLGGELDAGVYITATSSGIQDVGVRATGSSGFDVGAITPTVGSGMSYGVADMAGTGSI